MKRILIICGPTATGKTDLGISLAKRFNGEIVSADSRQAYKGMDIGTGKDIDNSKWQLVNDTLDKLKIGYYSLKGIKLWLLDMVDPDYQFSVADYVKCANSVIEDILKRGKLPILVGGTGFYIKGVVDGIETLGVSPDWKLREQLSHYDTETLRDELRKIAPEKLERMNESDKNNPRRLIRAMEIAKSSNNKAPLRSSGQASSNIFSNADILMVGLTAPYKILHQRIDERVDKRVEAGMENEIKALLSQGYGWDKSALGTTMAYREWQPYFENRQTKEETIKKWKFNEHGLSRRQMTWFKADERINWFDIDDIDFREKIVDLINKWYNKV